MGSHGNGRCNGGHDNNLSWRDKLEIRLEEIGNIGISTDNDHDHNGRTINDLNIEYLFCSIVLIVS